MPVTVMLPDGSSRELPEGATAADLAADIGKRLAKDAVIATIDGEERDLVTPLPENADVAIVTADSERGRYTIRHSTAHVLAQAVLDLFPGSTFAIGPPIEDGFYYDFELPAGGTFTLTTSNASRPACERSSPRNSPSSGTRSPRRKPKLFAHHPYKLEILEGAANDPMSATDKGLARTYENPPRFIDLCRGPHVPHTGRLGHFKLLRVAGAYWRGDERNPVLQRIYGTAWESEKALEDYLRRLAEAESATTGAWRPSSICSRSRTSSGEAWPSGIRGGRSCARSSRTTAGSGTSGAVISCAFSPHIARSTLWEISGHLDWYADAMYPPMVLDEQQYYPKPMNCPFHMLIFRSRQRSYRELPIRLFELGTVYRYERSGVLHGLMRIRGFTQDDSHIFCTREQLVDEISGLLDFSLDVLRAFGFDDFEAELSTRPQDRSVGDDDEWDEATTALRTAIERAGLEYEVAEGEGAFYGPKIDVHVRDAIGRRWQLSTIQVDFQFPQRFDLSYVGPDNTPPPVCDPPGADGIDRAVLRRAAGAPRGRIPRLARARARCGSFPSATITRSTPRASSSDWSTSASVRSWPRPATPWGADPSGQAGEGAIRPRGRRGRRGGQHGRGQRAPKRSRGTSRWTTSSSDWPPTWRSAGERIDRLRRGVPPSAAERTGDRGTQGRRH